MSKESTPRGMRLHIALLGRRNVGKSSVLNALTHQHTSIVSDQAGTTTDPVEKPMELKPLGPVLFIDTAGIDDDGVVGGLRVQRTKRVLDRADVAVVVTDEGALGAYERELLAALQERSVPCVVVFNKTDRWTPDSGLMAEAQRLGTAVRISAATGAGMGALRDALARAAPEAAEASPKIISDLVAPGELAVLVVPIDKEAPKGRLILPQVQTLRELLDQGALTMVVREHELRSALAALREPPKLVVTDSQAFAKVAQAVPPDVLLTGFSVLFARLKGDLTEQVLGAMAVDELGDGDRVLIAEACTHHPIEDDIGRVKIPAWLQRRAGAELRFEHGRGHDFPDALGGFKLVVHCGGCMLNRKEVQSRLTRCKAAGVPMTNYGLAIAYSLGLLERALGPFPEALAAYRARRAAIQPRQ